MPVKRRNTKRRLSDAALLEAWRCKFDTGHDFFGDLKAFGLVEPVHVWPPEARAEPEKALMDEAREAWAHLGAAFMAEWEPTSARQKPWALEQFGRPN